MPFETKSAPAEYLSLIALINKHYIIKMLISTTVSKALEFAELGQKDKALEQLDTVLSQLQKRNGRENAKTHALIEKIKDRLSQNKKPKSIYSAKVLEDVDHCLDRVTLEDIRSEFNGNKYSELDQTPATHYLSGELKDVCIVIPVYNRPKILAITLAAITHQSYPKDLIQVIVVDDGSKDETLKVIRKFEPLLNILYYWQPDKGYRPGQARTAGMRLSTASNIITLDCDMLPTKHLVAEFMSILNRRKTSILVGPRKYVCTDHLTADDVIKDYFWIDSLPEITTNNSVATGKYMGKKTVDWRHAFYKRTDFLNNSIFPFIAFASGNVAYSREAFEFTQGYDSEFEKWGSEDTEFGYRLFAEGFYIEPVMGALALHQEPPGGENEVDRATGYVHTKSILKEKCPLFSRDYEEGRVYRIAKYSYVNMTDLSDKDFAIYCDSLGYTDICIDSSLIAKEIGANKAVTKLNIKEFLKNNKSAFFVFVYSPAGLNIPKIIDEFFKKPDFDLNEILEKVNVLAKGEVICSWRGAFSRHINFKALV